MAELLRHTKEDRDQDLETEFLPQPVTVGDVQF